jgi:lysophospholipid acyltransferase (LPLAT)-like uncharacterized protein
MQQICEYVGLKLEKYLGAWLLLFLNLSLRFRVKQNSASRQPVIYVFWHRNLLPLLIQHRYTDSVVMISSSKDGQLVAGPAQVLGYTTARGSSTRGGDRAFREILRLAKNHVVAITPDGPKGPAEQMTDGALYLALLSGLPIVPIGVDIHSEWVVGSWDRFRIPKPFATIELYYGEPTYIRGKEEIPGKMEEIQALLKKLPGNVLQKGTGNSEQGTDSEQN